MLNFLFTPFASTPATLHFDPDTPSQIEGFTLHYDARTLNVRVDEVEEAKSIEIEIDSFHNILGPHMVEVTKGRWVIEYCGLGRSTHSATVVDDRFLLFSALPSHDDAKAVLQLVDEIIRIHQRYTTMLKSLVDKHSHALWCEGKDESSSLHLHGRRGNVSVYKAHHMALVYIQSDDEPPLFEQYLAREFAPASKQNPDSSYVLSCGGQHFPGAQYVENEFYMFSFHFPEDEAQIRMLVDAVVDVVKVEI
jgi:hypothetical protein